MMGFSWFFETLSQADAGVFVMLILPLGIYLVGALSMAWTGRWRRYVQLTFGGVAAVAMCYISAFVLMNLGSLYLMALAPGLILVIASSVILALPIALLRSRLANNHEPDFEEMKTE